jgi:2-haloacid dehalogenase
MTEFAQLRALVFDVFGTVVDWRTGVIREATRIGGPNHPDLDWAAFADAWRGRYNPSMELVRNGTLPWMTLDALHRQSLDELLIEFGATDLTPGQRDELVLAWHRLDPWPDVVAGLTRLRTKYVIGTLSNGGVGLLVDMAKRAALPWDLVLSADLVGHYKPDAETYRLPGRLLGVGPDQVMLVAAHLSDLLAARGQGLRTCFIPRPLEYGPAREPDSVDAATDIDVVQANFGDLATYLGC